MSLATHAANRLRKLYRLVLQRNAHLNARWSAYRPSEAASRFVGLEEMEPRLLLSTFTVTNAADSGAGSLRQAIISANGNSNPTVVDTIEFSSFFDTPRIISFGGGADDMDITQAVTIDGPGESLLTIDANEEDRVFYITGDNVTIRDLRIIDGAASSGGGIYIAYGAEHARIDTVTIANAEATTDGGGIYVSAEGATITNSTIAGTAPFGGGIAVGGADLTITDSTIEGTAPATFPLRPSGGGLNVRFPWSSAEIEGSTISGTADFTGGGISNSGTLRIWNSTIQNSSSRWGGGIFNQGDLKIYGHRDDPENLSSSTIIHNQAWVGGGIVNVKTMELVDVNITQNSAYDGAAIMSVDFFEFGVKTVIKYSYLTGNHTELFDEGRTSVGIGTPSDTTFNLGYGWDDMTPSVLGLRGGETYFINSLAVGNYIETNGAALGILGGPGQEFYLTNSTVADNTVDGFAWDYEEDEEVQNSAIGGGIWLQDNPDSKFHNSIIARNVVYNVAEEGYVPVDVYCDNPIYDYIDYARHNLFGVTDTSHFAIGYDHENFKGLVSDPWDPEFVDIGDYRLRLSSNAVNTGDNALAVDDVPQDLLTDLWRGIFPGITENDRIFDDDWDVVDMGAYECQLLN